MASRPPRPFRTENDRTSRQLVRQIQSLLTLLESLSAENSTSDPLAEPKTLDVYEDGQFRYISLQLPEDTGHEIDINIHDRLLFVRLEL